MSKLQDQMFRELKEKAIFHQAQAYAFEYLETIFDRNVYPSEEALANLNLFNEDLPDSGSNADSVLEQLHQHGSPATVATVGGRYFGFVTGSAVPIGIAAKNLGTYWDQVPAMEIMSPIGTKLEAVVQKWLVELLNLPSDTVAGYVTGASAANLCGLGAARYHLLNKNNWDINKQGLNAAPPIRIVAGRQAHSSVIKAINILGLGYGNIEWVAVDAQGRTLASALPELDSNTLVILQAGNVNSGAYDEFDKICDLAHAAGAWVHIDGAFGLWAAAAAPLQHLTKGIEKADSWALDGHKTLNTPYDCGIVLCANQTALHSALHMSGSYIIESPERDGMYYTPDMSRRSRIIELWAIMKYLGKNGIAEMILTMHERANQFASSLRQEEGFFIDNKIVFNQVLVRCESDELTLAVLEKVQQLRVCWLGGSIWSGNRVMRVSVSRKTTSGRRTNSERLDEKIAWVSRLGNSL